MKSFRIFFYLLFLLSCSPKLKSKQTFFQRYDPKDPLLRESIILNKTKIKEYVGYNFIFNSWFGSYEKNQFMPQFKMNGFIFDSLNIIYFLDTNTNKISKLFDFNLRKNDSILVDFTFSSKLDSNSGIKVVKSYYLILEDQFYDKNFNDSIYKFRLDKFGIIRDEDDLVYFISKDRGILGVYIGDKLFNGSKEIDFIEIKEIGEIYKNRYFLDYVFSYK